MLYKEHFLLSNFNGISLKDLSFISIISCQTVVQLYLRFCTISTVKVSVLKMQFYKKVSTIKSFPY